MHTCNLPPMQNNYPKQLIHISSFDLNTQTINIHYPLAHKENKIKYHILILKKVSWNTKLKIKTSEKKLKRHELLYLNNC